MKAKDALRKLVGFPTSEERRQAEKKKERELIQRVQKAEKTRVAKEREKAQKNQKSVEDLQLRVIEDYEADARRPDFDARIPHPALNYNQKPCQSYAVYKDVFAREALLRQLPALLGLGGYAPGKDFTLLDYGCGLGRLAYAFTSFFHPATQGSHHYYGYEVHPKALAFLQDAYRIYPNVTVFGEPIAVEDSYVEIHEGERSEAEEGPERIGATQVRLGSRIGRPVDVQFSSSVFTHMYRPAIVSVLKEIATLMKPGGVCVNTWLVVDQLADASLRCGLADRALPFENKEEGFLYYLENNPLMCTAYRLDAIKAIYAEAGHEIVDIRWGHWSGREPTHDFSRQDAIISRPLGG